MKKLVKLILIGTVVVSAIGAATLPVDVYAVNVFSPCEGVESAVCAATEDDDAANMIKTVINTLLYILGVIAVLMIVIGGVRYTTSNGEASSLKAAKDTILYAVIGLVVAIMAYAIVNFVVGRFIG